ncbi:DMT family transporter [Undibacterium flavidum]|uniref:EamA family transporter n=1 Tax=Undibacterium flavidum TaxID=2762297 RepID=A0ABR6Y7F4_9BURK|nr:DMT family transporter [Undibacterium flavidum]MBC3872528.1 EamA family transporter [Undibacterium flavidum]
MSTSAFLLVILAGLIHALWNIAAKKAGGDVRFAGFSSLIMAAVWAPVGLYVGWDVVPAWGWLEWAFIAASGLLHVLYFITLLRGYRKADLTVVYPLARGSGPLISSAVAILFLGEHLTLIGGAGVLAVVGGVFLIAGGPRLLRSLRQVKDASSQASADGSDHHAGALRIRKGIFYGLCTGLFIAAYTVLDGYTVKVLMLSPILVDYFGNFVRIGLLLPALLRDTAATLSSWQKEWKYAFVVGAISPISYVLVLYAMQAAPLSHVAPAREVSMLFAALIGGHLLDEGDRVQRLLGALFIAAGVIALGKF